jgi:LysR family glycine cleavage system transcriptional activator
MRRRSIPVISGLGVGQASPYFIEQELRSGQLIALGPMFGGYEIADYPEPVHEKSFSNWLSPWGNVET